MCSMQVRECMCHRVKDMLEDKQPSLTIHISVSTREPILVLVIHTRDFRSTAALTSHLQATLVHSQAPMEIHIPATLMT